jgi:hypothetical protein
MDMSDLRQAVEAQQREIAEKLEALEAAEAAVERVHQLFGVSLVPVGGAPEALEREAGLGGLRPRPFCRPQGRSKRHVFAVGRCSSSGRAVGCPESFVLRGVGRRITAGYHARASSKATACCPSRLRRPRRRRTMPLLRRPE